MVWSLADSSKMAMTRSARSKKSLGLCATATMAASAGATSSTPLVALLALSVAARQTAATQAAAARFRRFPAMSSLSYPCAVNQAPHRRDSRAAHPMHTMPHTLRAGDYTGSANLEPSQNSGSTGRGEGRPLGNQPL